MWPSKYLPKIFSTRHNTQHIQPNQCFHPGNFPQYTPYSFDAQIHIYRKCYINIYYVFIYDDRIALNCIELALKIRGKATAENAVIELLHRRIPNTQLENEEQCEFGGMMQDHGVDGIHQRYLNAVGLGFARVENLNYIKLIENHPVWFQMVTNILAKC